METTIEHAGAVPQPHPGSALEVLRVSARLGVTSQPFQGAAIFGNFVPPARSNDPMEEGQRCR